MLIKKKSTYVVDACAARGDTNIMRGGVGTKTFPLTS